METKRRKLQGVVNILSFNRHFYIIGLIALFIIIMCQKLFFSNSNFNWIVIALFAYGFITPLLVSAYVYDFSNYYKLNWLRKFNIKDSNITKIVSINAGFDETSFLIKNKFPKSNLEVFDFYNENKHTEMAIKRARKASLVFPNTKVITTEHVPLESQSVDVVFLLSTAHEIRSDLEKIIFLKECFRIIKPNGRVIMVEHLRDIPNFLSFTIGFTHFFSKKTWLKVFKKSGFKLYKEIKFTPFMSVFNFSKQLNLNIN